MKITLSVTCHSTKGHDPWLFYFFILLANCAYFCKGAVPIDPRLAAPWVASIFHKNSANNLWEYVCGGTITSANTVITSARCVLPRISQSSNLSGRPYHYNYADIQVVVGLKTNNLDEKDQFTQIGTVGQIRDLFVSVENHPDTPYQDLAAIRLKNQFNISTPYVKDVLLTQFAQTILEANATKSGDKVVVAGFERIDVFSTGVKTRSRTNQTLKIHEVVLTNIGTCIDRYTSSYDAFYFDVMCGKGKSTKDIIPCRFEGAGMITQGIFDPKAKNAKVEFYLMGVYSSNTALSKSEGSIKAKNEINPGDCTENDVIFFTKLGYLGRWGISHDFCGHDLAMCVNNKCRPWEDLCDGSPQCDDQSDESQQMCHSQKSKKVM